MDLMRSTTRGGAPGPVRVSWRTIAFLGILILYVLLTLGVIYRSPILAVDRDVLGLDLRGRWPGAFTWIDHYVMLGQRAPSTALALPWIAWRAWRARSPRPLVMLATALVVLNLSVGVVKLATGRLGPLRTANVHAVFAEGGNIFPSGHVSNAVVLYGIMAWIAVTYRKSAIAAAVFVSLTVGLSTIYLDTHWLSDVVGGWAAGGLVLLALPWMLPTAERWVDTALQPVRLWLGHRMSRELHPGKPLGADPEFGRDGLVLGRSRGADPVGVAPRLPDAVRPEVVSAGGGGHGRGTEPG